MYAGARDSVSAPDFKFLNQPGASSSGYSRRCCIQAVGHALKHFTITGIGIGAGREDGLLTGVQMADEDG
jgi:hypothetical protein